MKKTQELLVEGNDDLHVVTALCQKFDIPETFGIVDNKGIENILSSLPVRLKGSSTMKTIGVIIDADTNLKARWDSIRNILAASGKYADIPTECPTDGLILDPTVTEDVRFGLWIMPDNRTDGMLEHFTTMLISGDDDLLPIVDETLSRIESKGLNRYALIHHEKARIHTWLAWQETPGTPMGLAITKKYLTTEPPLCGDFVGWLRRLFGDV